ncbi:MAG: hypothetical protein K6U03_09835, partial [Firmicutes bacterium]|nr:hypothetical protein [Bacillota bacterium]
EIIWQMKKMFRLPAWLSLKFEDDRDGVRIIHELRVGFAGPGRIFDPLIRLFISREFEAALNEHAAIEFNKLADLLGAPV